MIKREFIIITSEPIDASNTDNSSFTNIGANALVKVITFVIDDSNDFNIQEPKNDLVNHDILKGLDGTIGACLIRKSETNPGLFHESWSVANIDLIGKFLEDLKIAVSTKDENNVVRAIREKYRNLKIDKLI